MPVSLVPAATLPGDQRRRAYGHGIGLAIDVRRIR